MQYTPTRGRWTTIIAILAIAIGMVTFASSYPPATADIRHDFNGKDIEHIHKEDLKEHSDAQFSQAHQIKLLIGVVIALFGGNMWWIKRWMCKLEQVEEKREKKEGLVLDKISKVHTTVSTLKAEHDLIQQVRGCAADPTILETSIRDAVQNSLQPLFNYHLHGRTQDRDNFRNGDE